MSSLCVDNAYGGSLGFNANRLLYAAYAVINDNLTVDTRCQPIGPLSRGSTQVSWLYVACSMGLVTVGNVTV